MKKKDKTLLLAGAGGIGLLYLLGKNQQIFALPQQQQQQQQQQQPPLSGGQLPPATSTGSTATQAPGSTSTTTTTTGTPGTTATSTSSQGTALTTTTTTTTTSQQQTATPPPATTVTPTKLQVGTIVPLYTYPTDQSWYDVINAKIKHPQNTIIAIINPNNGPGSSSNVDYYNGIKNLADHGVIVAGYIYTGYGSRANWQVENDMYLYSQWYAKAGLSAIFLDEMANVPGQEAYYSNLTAVLKKMGFLLSIGNPGANSTTSYANTVDIILLYESSGLPSIDNYTAYWGNYDRNKLGIIPYNVLNLDLQWLQKAVKQFRFIYVTNDSLPNPWDTLSVYFDNLLTDEYADA